MPIIKCLLEDNYSTDEFVEIMNIVLDESPNILTRHNCDNSFIILVSQKSKQLVEAIERDKKLVLQCVKHEGNLQYTIVCGNEEEVKNVIGQMKNIAIGAGTGHEWKAAFALSYTAYQQLLLSIIKFNTLIIVKMGGVIMPPPVLVFRRCICQVWQGRNTCVS